MSPCPPCRFQCDHPCDEYLDRNRVSLEILCQLEPRPGRRIKALRCNGGVVRTVFPRWAVRAFVFAPFVVSRLKILTRGAGCIRAVFSRSIRSHFAASAGKGRNFPCPLTRGAARKLDPKGTGADPVPPVSLVGRTARPNAHLQFSPRARRAMERDYPPSSRLLPDARRGCLFASPSKSSSRYEPVAGDRTSHSARKAERAVLTARGHRRRLFGGGCGRGGEVWRRVRRAAHQGRANKLGRGS